MQPLARIAFDDRNVDRREHDSPQYADDLPGMPERRTVELGPIGFAGSDLELQRQLARIVNAGLHPGPHHRAGGARTYQRHLGSYAMRAHRGEILDRLNEVGLALPIRPDKGGRA